MLLGRSESHAVHDDVQLIGCSLDLSRNRLGDLGIVGEIAAQALGAGQGENEVAWPPAPSRSF
jgi:hypothetical protein